jgi:imidazole glycerol phosphate synthase subunit HisF
MDGVFDLVRAGVPGAERIYNAGPDPEHDRVIIETDRVNDQLLEAIAARFGVDVIAVRVDPRATPLHLL